MYKSLSDQNDSAQLVDPELDRPVPGPVLQKRADLGDPDEELRATRRLSLNAVLGVSGVTF
jgi:hypothetical protein